MISAAVSTVHNTHKSSMDMSLRSNPTSINSEVGLLTKEELYGKNGINLHTGRGENICLVVDPQNIVILYLKSTILYVTR